MNTINTAMKPTFGAVHNFNKNPFGTPVMSIGKPETHPNLLKVAQKCKNQGVPYEVGDLNSRYANFIFTGKDGEMWETLNNIQKMISDQINVPVTNYPLYQGNGLSSKSVGAQPDVIDQLQALRRTIFKDKTKFTLEMNLVNHELDLKDNLKNISSAIKSYQDNLQKVRYLIQRLMDDMCRSAKPKG